MPVHLLFFDHTKKSIKSYRKYITIDTDEYKSAFVCSDVKDLEEGQDVIKPIEKPIKISGHLRMLYGNLAEEGSVAKITGKEGLRFSGKAKVYDVDVDQEQELAVEFGVRGVPSTFFLKDGILK